MNSAKENGNLRMAVAAYLATALNLLMILVVCFSLMPDIRDNSRQINENEVLIKKNETLLRDNDATLKKNAGMIETNNAILKENDKLLAVILAKLKKE